MNAKERNKLQQYIGHCSNLDEQIRYIETVNSVSPLTDEDWYKLYFPAVEIVMSHYLSGYKREEQKSTMMQHLY